MPQDNDNIKNAEPPKAGEDQPEPKREVGSSLILFALAAIAFSLPTLMDQGPKYQHQMLVATENLDENEVFAETVIYLTQHHMGGAKGVIVNRPDKVMTFEELFELLGVRFKDTQGELLVWNGGPVHADKFGILHTPDVTTRKSKDAGAGLKATDESMNMVSKMAKGAGPEKAKLFWGMSGWGPKQLEGEVARGDWYVIKADHDLIFADDPTTVYDTAMEHYVLEQEEKEKQAAAGQ